MILSFDDFYEGCTSYDLLFKLKKRIPQLKVNIFTILGRCSLNWIKNTSAIPWIELIPHGWFHNGPECKIWTKEETLDYLDLIKPLELTKGFKAPGYVASKGTYEAIIERDYWICDIERRSGRWPKGLRVYLNNTPDRVQGHIGRLPGHFGRMKDGLKEKFDYYASLTGEFLFIKDIM